MKNLTVRLLVFAALLSPMAPAFATTIDVTNASQVTLAANDDLIFYIAADYSGEVPQYPGAIQILLGGMPVGGPVAAITGTSGVYMPGILFSGKLESGNGAISVPVTDSNATRLGLTAGAMLLTPGSRSGGSYSGVIDLLSGAAPVSSQDATALFGSGEIAIDLHNSGGAITFGYPDSTVASDFSASLISSDGLQSMGARVLRVQCVTTTPEPGTVGLLLIGLAIIGTRLNRLRVAGRN